MSSANVAEAGSAPKLSQAQNKWWKLVSKKEDTPEACEMHEIGRTMDESGAIVIAPLEETGREGVESGSLEEQARSQPWIEIKPEVKEEAPSGGETGTAGQRGQMGGSTSSQRRTPCEPSSANQRGERDECRDFWDVSSINSGDAGWDASVPLVRCSALLPWPRSESGSPNRGSDANWYVLVCFVSEVHRSQ